MDNINLTQQTLYLVMGIFSGKNNIRSELEQGEDKVYLLPSEWWRSMVNKPEPWPDQIKFVFGQLLIYQNEFISERISTVACTVPEV